MDCDRRRDFFILKITESFCSSPFRASGKLWQRKLKALTSTRHNLLECKLSVISLELPFGVTFLLDNMLPMRRLSGISRASLAIPLDFRAPPSEKGIVWRQLQPYSQLKGATCQQSKRRCLFTHYQYMHIPVYAHSCQSQGS